MFFGFIFIFYNKIIISQNLAQADFLCAKHMVIFFNFIFLMTALALSHTGIAIFVYLSLSA